MPDGLVLNAPLETLLVTSTEASKAISTMTPAPAKAVKPRAFRGPALAMLLGGVFGALGVIAGRAASGNEWIYLRFDAFGVYDLLLLPATLFLVILIHELGHLCGGWMRGMRFLLLIVGPLRLRRTLSGLKLDWFVNGGTFGGLAAAMPDPQRSMRGQLLPLVMGGPLASLLLAGVALWLATGSDGRWSAHLLILGGLSALIFVATAVPTRAGGFLSDGRQCLEMLRGGAAVEQRAMLMAAYAQSLSGVRPRDRDPAPLARALALSGDEPLRDITAALMAYQLALDRREMAAAGEWVDTLAAGHDAYPAGFRQGLACEIAYFSARYRGDADTAKLWYARAQGGVVEASQRALAEAAIALADGDAALALRSVLRGEQRLRDSSDAGSIPLLQDELAALRRDAEAELSRST
jgi:hypothetical protein